jgi:hypothetical protein
LEAEFEALLATVEEDIPVNFLPCEVSETFTVLEIRKALWFWWHSK